MNPLEIIYTLALIALFYAVFARMKVCEARLTRLENQRKPEPEKRVSIPTIQQLYPPVENFTPKKPETLRPNQVRGRDIQGVENVIEFDVKIKG